MSLMSLVLYCFEAYDSNRGVKYSIKVPANQTSSAWLQAADKASRIGSFNMTHLTLMETQPLPEEIDQYLQKLDRS